MTTWSTRAIGIAFALIFGAGAAATQEGTSPPPDIAQQGDGPFVLRGSGMPPPAPPAAMDPRRWQVAAGDELWLVDPAAGVAVACILRSTHRVGERVIRCRTGDLPRVVTD